MNRSSLAAALALLLAACGDGSSDLLGKAEPSPLLFEITSSSGETEGWLFGTIHALPDGTVWRTERLAEAAADAELLVVEIAGLEDRAALTQAYTALSRTPGQPDIATRVAPSIRPQLFDLIDRSGLSPHDFSSVETWAAALTLAQVSTTGDPENGVDRALLREFSGREIREFEGISAQLGIFDQLPEADQRDLLAGVIAESQSTEPDRLRKAWLAGDEAVLEEATRSGIMADPELRQAILTGRNRAWASQLADMLEAPEQPLVAVGAAHLVGPEGLPALLEASGYRVKRVQ